MNKLSINLNNLKFDIRWIDMNTTIPLLIFLHGFKSFRNWGFIPYLCERISEKGFITLNLDFSYNGILSENPIKFNVEIFANNTITQEVQDVNILLTILFDKSKWDGNLHQALKNWNGKVHIGGHSRGAGIAIIAAEKFNVIQKIVLLSAISDFNRYTPRLIDKWIKDGFLEFNDPESNQKLRMNSDYILDLLENRDKYNLKGIMQRLDKPTLFIVGDNDLTTPIKESLELKENYEKYKNYKQNHCNFAIIKKANHLFNCNHPFKGTNVYLDEALQRIEDFLFYGQI